jgi:hypothetical protein
MCIYALFLVPIDTAVCSFLRVPYIHTYIHTYIYIHIYTGGADSVVVIWSSSGKGLLKYTHTSPVQRVVYNPATLMLASCADVSRCRSSYIHLIRAVVVGVVVVVILVWLRAYVVVGVIVVVLKCMRVGRY